MCACSAAPTWPTLVFLCRRANSCFYVCQNLNMIILFLVFFPHSGSQEIDGPHFPAKRVGGRFYDCKIELLLFVIFFTTFGLVRWPASSSQGSDTWAKQCVPEWLKPWYPPFIQHSDSSIVSFSGVLFEARLSSNSGRSWLSRCPVAPSASDWAHCLHGSFQTD